MPHSPWRRGLLKSLAMIDMFLRSFRGVGLTQLGGGVLLYVAAVLEEEADVHLPLACEAGISFPQSGKRLVNRPRSVLNRVGLYLAVAWGDGLFPVLPCKGVYDMDQVPVQYEFGFKGHVPTEHGPLCPVHIGNSGSSCRESLINDVCHSAEAIA